LNYHVDATATRRVARTTYQIPIPNSAKSHGSKVAASGLAHRCRAELLCFTPVLVSATNRTTIIRTQNLKGTRIWRV
jgi:hypothetical protein